MGLTALDRSAILEPAASSVAPGVLQAAGPPGRGYLEKTQVSPSCILRAVHRNSSPCTPHFQPPFLTRGARGLQSHTEVVAEPRAASSSWDACGLQRDCWKSEQFLLPGGRPVARARKILSSTPHKEPHRDSESGVYCPQTRRDGHECPRFLLIPGRAQLPVSSSRAGGSRAGAGEYVDRK